MTSFFVGHRGASAEKPENTMLLFKSAIATGMTAFELDVVQSQDGIPFVMHDDRVDRTTDGAGNCYDLSWATVAALDAGSWKNTVFAGEKAPRLEDVLNSFRSQAVFILVEIKDNVNYGSLPQRVASLIREKQMENQCLVMSANWDYADTVKAENPKCITGILGSGNSITDAIARAISAGHRFISWDFRSITPDMVNLVHASGLTLNVWTVNNALDIQNMIDLGIDSISGDYTARLKTAADNNAIIPITPTASDPFPNHR